MGVFDQAARYAARMEPDAVLPHLLGKAYPGRRLGWLMTRTVPMPGGADRDADLIAECEDAEGRLLLVLEFQSSHDPEKLDTTLLEVATLRKFERYGEAREYKYKVVAAFVYLVGECPGAVLAMTVNGRGTTHEALVWNVGAGKAREALDKLEAGEVSWGTLFWVPLMDGGADEDVIQRWKVLVDRLAPSADVKAALYGIARVFASLVGKVPEWDRGIGVQLMTESIVVNKWIEMGRLDEAKKILRRQIRSRYPAMLTPEVDAAIEDQPSHDLLMSWLEEFATAENAEAFLAVLRR